ncbi:DUF6193 family natural product biosynthesis protein [Streptomyces sp. NPDC057291]|uniref:DUF6193 family natural product biosynthesis protein n=1 Tax=Streptomyces sp. NPDC057291 TaxID=3346087 RepID=UPI00362F810B
MAEPALRALYPFTSHWVLGFATTTRPRLATVGPCLSALAEVGPPIQPVPATDDRDVAEHWYETLQAQGLEGVVAKRGTAAYPSGHRG